MKILREDIDSNPYSGKRSVKGFLKVKNDASLNHFFNGCKNVEQVANVDQGKTYQVVSVEGFGDCEDVTILDNNGNELDLADFFFEEVE